MERVIIYGAGNAGKKALEALVRQNKYSCQGFIDDNIPKDIFIQNIPIIGSETDLDFIYFGGTKNAFVAIGNNYKRAKITEKLENKGFKLISIIDPSAFVSCEANIGRGVLIMPNVYIGHNTKLENNVVCQSNSVISHFVVVGDSSNIGYGSIISAYAKIGRFSRIGIGAKVLNKINIGENTMIGAGSVITKNIPSGVLAYGVPARVIRDFDIVNYDPNIGNIENE